MFLRHHGSPLNRKKHIKANQAFCNKKKNREPKLPELLTYMKKLNNNFFD